MARLIAGYYTIGDDKLFQLLAQLNQHEDIQLEPSALAGMLGPVVVNRSSHLAAINHQQASHIVWATGGGMVPTEALNAYIKRGEQSSIAI
jgi:D-serine dehydratase